MKYMCKDCKDVFTANNDNEVKWVWNYPVCTDCEHKKDDEEE